MKILSEKFNSDDEARTFWDNCIYDMLDISIYLADNGLVNEGQEFCEVFSKRKILDVITMYKFNFEIIKRYLEVPQKYVDRSIDIPNLNFSKDNVVVDEKKMQELKQKFDEIMSTLLSEISIISK